MKYTLTIGIVFLSIGSEANAMERKKLNLEEKKFIEVEEQKFIKLSPRGPSAQTSPKSARFKDKPKQPSTSDPIINKDNIPDEFLRKSAKLTVSSQAIKQLSSSSSTEEKK